MVRIEDLTFQYTQTKHRFTFPDVLLNDQEDLLILGKSGVGKTTLIHLLAGILKPNKGDVFIDNTAISCLSASELDRFRGKNIGLVFQRNHAIQSLSVFKNLQARLFFSKKNIDSSVINKLLSELDLTAQQHHKIHQLSVGQLQRLGIAMSVIHNPKVILADEPTSSLDDENCNIVIELLKKQARKNNANLIVVTHDQRIQSFFNNTITL